MNPNQNSKLSRHSKEHVAGINRAKSAEASQAALEFASPEEMIRHDAAQTVVPDRVAERLQASIRQEPPRSRTWWERLFGR